ncbi:MAG TPA: SCO family protein [Solirubrobacteraceae bacterium]|jgi:protein SCO1/2|nr:SCO family protein [Solirubrobacteraceae bacterium]
MPPTRSIAVRAACAGLASVLSLAAVGCSSGSTSSTGSSASSAGSAATDSPTSAPAAATPSASGFDGAAIPPGAPARDFTLSDQRGARVSLSSTRGKVTILAFPYSTCGDACVVIAEQIRGALDELAKPVPVLLVSADPQADTPARVRRFLARTSLTGRVQYLTGSLAQLQPIWRSFRVVPASAGKAAFDDSASVFLLDRDGRERVIFQLEQLTPEALAHDVRKLLE